jgi:hypothetical protein
VLFRIAKLSKYVNPVARRWSGDHGAADEECRPGVDLLSTRFVGHIDLPGLYLLPF